MTQIVEKLLDIANNYPEQAENIWDEYVLKIKDANKIGLAEAENAAKRNVEYSDDEPDNIIRDRLLEKIQNEKKINKESEE